MGRSVLAIFACWLLFALLGLAWSVIGRCAYGWVLVCGEYAHVVLVVFVFFDGCKDVWGVYVVSVLAQSDLGIVISLAWIWVGCLCIGMLMVLSESYACLMCGR